MLTPYLVVCLSGSAALPAPRDARLGHQRVFVEQERARVAVEPVDVFRRASREALREGEEEAGIARFIGSWVEDPGLGGSVGPEGLELAQFADDDIERAAAEGDRGGRCRSRRREAENRGDQGHQDA